MRFDNQTGYGLKNKKLVHISEVSRGNACECICVVCLQPLLAKKGSERKHHFAHVVDSNCHGAAETVLHLLAKELICALTSIAIPKYDFVIERITKRGATVRHEQTVVKGGMVNIDSVVAEKSEQGFVPDIIIKSGSKKLIVEIAVTNKVSRQKMRRIRQGDFPAIEIRLDLSDALLTRDELRQKLKDDSESKFWLFHPAQREAERIFIENYRAVVARERLVKGGDRVMKVQNKTNKLQSIHQPVQYSQYEYDRTAEEFRRKHNRYPTVEECLRLWPHLWKP